MKEVFEITAEEVESIDWKKIKTIKYQYNNHDISNQWCYDPICIEKEIETKYLDYAENEFKGLQIEMTGKQILEVTADGKE